MDLSESPFTSKTSAGGGGLPTSPPDAPSCCHRHSHNSPPKRFTPTIPHKNQSNSPHSRAHTRQHEQRTRREAHRRTRQQRRRAHARIANRRKRTTINILSTNQTTPHKKNHPLTPPNRTDTSKHGLRNLRKLLEMRSWSTSQRLSKMPYM